MTKKLNTWPIFSKEEGDMVKKVLLSNKVNYWTGNICRNFEREFANWSNTNYSIALTNGTVALDLALISLGIKEKDEVIVTPRSFIASASSVVNVGATPIFSDIDPVTGNISAEYIEKKINKKTKAIICVHLGGLPCEMDAIMKLAKKYGLYVIEDCAQAHGALYKGKSVGSIGDIGAWSFCQDKIMTTGGEGGMVTTNNKQLWKKMWSFKDHGKNLDSIEKPSKKVGFKWVHDSFGTNWRRTEMQAAIGLIQLKKMNSWNLSRNKNAKSIINTLYKFSEFIELPLVPVDIQHAYYRVYANIKIDVLNKPWTRDKIVQELNAKGVPCFTGSCAEIYMEKAFTGSRFSPKKRLINAKSLGESSIAFLCHPTLSRSDLKFMCANIEAVLKKVSH